MGIWRLGKVRRFGALILVEGFKIGRMKGYMLSLMGNGVDRVCWKFSKQGIFDVKSYHHVLNPGLGWLFWCVLLLLARF